MTLDSSSRQIWTCSISSTKLYIRPLDDGFVIVTTSGVRNPEKIIKKSTFCPKKSSFMKISKIKNRNSSQIQLNSVYFITIVMLFELN
jgi:hypothetical protein